MSGASSRRGVEWPTVALLAGFFAVWGTVIGWHRHIPWPIELGLLVFLGGLWLSIGHELLHGHPTRWNWVNTTIGMLPLSLWIPFARYKTTHVQHHHSDLTDPFDDPETSYLDPSVWQAAGPLKRRYLVALRTTPVRFTIGVPVAVLRFWWRDAKLARSHLAIARQWLVHVALAVPFGWLLFDVVGMSAWVYVFGFVLGGAACSMVRSFVEHCAVPSGTRSAVVQAGPALSLLFLNINLHHTHHELPDVVWYRIPEMHRRMGSDDIAAAGAGLYRNYWEVLTTYFLTPFCQPDHPGSPGARPYGARGIA
ncbi:MAG: fatty acid desaturase [Actinomycetota bacterium]